MNCCAPDARGDDVTFDVVERIMKKWACEVLEESRKHVREPIRKAIDEYVQKKPSCAMPEKFETDCDLAQALCCLVSEPVERHDVRKILDDLRKDVLDIQGHYAEKFDANARTLRAELPLGLLYWFDISLEGWRRPACCNVEKGRRKGECCRVAECCKCNVDLYEIVTGHPLDLRHRREKHRWPKIFAEPRMDCLDKAISGVTGSLRDKAQKALNEKSERGNLARRYEEAQAERAALLKELVKAPTGRKHEFVEKLKLIGYELAELRALLHLPKGEESNG